MSDNFITFDALRNFATLATVLVIVTQFSKGAWDWLTALVTVGRLARLPTRLLVFGYALGILFLQGSRAGPWTPEALVSTVLNAVFVTLAAMKAYESVAPSMQRLTNGHSSTAAAPVTALTPDWSQFLKDWASAELPATPAPPPGQPPPEGSG